MTRTFLPRFLPLFALLLLLAGPVGLRTAEAVTPAGEIVPATDRPTAAEAMATMANDYIVIVSGQVPDAQKYLTFGWNGWSGGTLRWRYNDSNRPAALVASSGAMVTRIQAAMAKWSAVCNVHFVYDGATSNGPSLSTGVRDSINVIAWGVLTGNTTGVTYTGASGFSNATLTLDETDMVINYQFNPNLDATLVHEVGHMLGLKHSNQEGAVMSGPNTAPDPSTAYTGLVELQADDIAGCRSLYGAADGTPSAPIASLSSSTLSFADITVGTAAATQSVTLTNTGSVTLTVNSTIVSGSDFALASTTCNAGTSVAPGASCVATARFTPTTSGVRSGTLTFFHNASPSSSVVALSGNGVASTTASKRQMVEFHYDPLDYYFITSRDAEKTQLDATTGWVRTGASFPVYASQQTGTRGITRFYFDAVARNGTRGSHFYTLLDSDIALLNSQNPAHIMAPGLPQNEDIDSYAFLPAVTGVGGSCASGLIPVYRLFRGALRFPDDPNHRYTTSISVYNSFVAQGWNGEGVNFCVPPA